MLLSAAAAVAQPPVPIPPATTPPVAPPDTRWSPPGQRPAVPPQPVRPLPLQPADAPPPARPIVLPTLPAPPTPPSATPQVPPAAAPAAPTRPVLTLQKPAGADEPKVDPKLRSDPKLPPPANPGATDQKTDRDPPRSLRTRSGQIDKAELFRFDSEDDLRRRIVRELVADQTERERQNPPENPAPVDPKFFAPPQADPMVAAGVTYQPKTQSYPPGQMLIEPGYVVHRRLHFEDVNSERYGWEVGIAQPAISTLIFWKDAILFPVKLASNFGEWYDTSAGKCLPGSPVPYKLYPEPVDAFGILVGAGTIVGGVAVVSGL